MTTLFNRRFATAFLLLVSTGLVFACNEPTPTTLVNFAISDAPVGDLEAVVITIDRITLNRPGDDIVIDSFPNDDPDGEDTDSITIDLLDVQGLDNILIVDGIELEVGKYQNIRLRIIDSNIDLTYVEEAGGEHKPLKQPSNELKLGGFTVEDSGVQSFILEFNLPKAMTYNPGPDRYILKPRGVRIVDIEAAVTIAGVVDDALFDGVAPCDAKPEAEVGNAVYLYRGHDLDTDALGDLFDPDIDTDAAANLIEPHASEKVAEDGSYMFGYLHPGDYTLAFSCDAEMDDPDYDDGIGIPTPMDELVEVSLAPGEELSCDFPILGGVCG